MGLWVVALAFLGFSDSTQRILLVLAGLAIAIASFWGKTLISPTEDLVDSAEEAFEIIKDSKERQEF